MFSMVQTQTVEEATKRLKEELDSCKFLWKKKLEIFRYV
jgi:hypothetical protein